MIEIVFLSLIVFVTGFIAGSISGSARMLRAIEKWFIDRGYNKESVKCIINKLREYE